MTAADTNGFVPLGPPNPEGPPPPADAVVIDLRRSRRTQDHHHINDPDWSDPNWAKALDTELGKILLRSKAKELATNKAANELYRPAPTVGTDFFAEPDCATKWRVTGLLPSGGRVILSAARKSGKTTLIGNLVKSLVDGDSFLNRFECSPVTEVLPEYRDLDYESATGTVGIIDTEMPREMLRSWLRDQNIRNVQHLNIWTLRGMVGSFDILSSQGAQWWADCLRTYRIDVLIIDCLSPIMSALGLNPDNQFRTFANGLDELCDMAGIQEVIVCDHMGHSHERGRGDSNKRDWPDVEWRLVRERDDQGDEIDRSPRFFSAYGRDVDIEESLLSFDVSSRHLSIGTESRDGHRRDKALRQVLLAVQELGNPTTNALYGRVGGNKVKVLESLKLAESWLFLEVNKVGNANIHTITPAGVSFLTGDGLSV